MATLRQTFSDIASAIRAKGVSGTFKPIDMASKIGEIQTGGGGGEDYGYLTFTAVDTTTLTLEQSGGIEPLKLLKSIDAVTWTKWENPSTNGISLNPGESVYIKADEDASWKTGDNYAYNTFKSTGLINCCGDVTSIVKAQVPANYDGWVCSLFNSCNTLLTAPELPSTILTESCYYNMFSYCTSLTQAPELPATTATQNCYQGMFNGCTALTQAPALPATNMHNFCYNRMFKGCTALTQAPALPATNMQAQCYQEMFSGCTSLTQAPVLPATTLAESCYSYDDMFRNCTALKRIKMNASSGKWGDNMFNGCTSLELVDMTGSTGVPQLSNVNNFDNTNDTYKIVVPDSLYDTWIAETNWASIASHIMKQSDWNAEHPDDQL